MTRSYFVQTTYTIVDVINRYLLPLLFDMSYGATAGASAANSNLIEFMYDVQWWYLFIHYVDDDDDDDDNDNNAVWRNWDSVSSKIFFLHICGHNLCMCWEWLIADLGERNHFISFPIFSMFCKYILVIKS